MAIFVICPNNLALTAKFLNFSTLHVVQVVQNNISLLICAKTMVVLQLPLESLHLLFLSPEYS